MRSKKNNKYILIKVIILSILSSVFNCVLVWFSGIETCRIVIENIVIPNLFIKNVDQIALLMNEYFFVPRLVFMMISNVIFGIIIYFLIKEHKRII